MTSFTLYEAGDRTSVVAKIEAATARDALAEYSIQQGFADPRAQDEDDDEWFFSTLDDGIVTVGMVFTNTELVAVPSYSTELPRPSHPKR